MTTLNTGGRRRGAAAFANHQIEAERGISRKELATCARDAEKALNLRLSERLVLRELAGSFGEVPIEDRLLVWPSNEYLAARTGLSERAIRYALKSLAAQNLIVFKDSANGKRYARRDLAGTIVSAFGFDLMPLYARRVEWADRLTERKLLHMARAQAYDEITVCRRAVEELIDALATHYPQAGHTELEELLTLARRAAPKRDWSHDPAEALERFRKLRNYAEKVFYEAANAGNACPHKETNNGSPSETCQKGFRKEAEPDRSTEQRESVVSPTLIVEACPALASLDVRIRDVPTLVGAASYLRGSIGASQDAWNEAVRLLGAPLAAAALIYVLQLHEDDVASGTHRIQNPGGYFRALCRLIDERKFSLETEFFALRRRHMT